ncbi:MAG: ABC transporter permease, partial [Candidatus Hydrogenedens sp.]|nr:ABC transporter permease [Candidatus Hydrogenedens sp.]
MKRILGAGISSTLYRIIFGVQSQLISITGFQNINIPGL